jgi:hypothetical protein
LVRGRGGGRVPRVCQARFPENRYGRSANWPTRVVCCPSIAPARSIRAPGATARLSSIVLYATKP